LKSSAISGTITGCVVNQKGIFVPYGVVRVPTADRGALVDAKGHFVIADLPAGSHVVSTKNVGYAVMQIEGVEVSAGKATDMAFVLSETPVTCAGRTEVRTAAPREEPGMDTGRTGIVTGTVLDESKVPVGSVSVVVLPSQIGGLTGSNGIFRLPGVQSGTYTIVARKAGFPAGECRVRVKAGQTSIVNLRLKARSSTAEGP
jgi:hypothetical protein